MTSLADLGGTYDAQAPVDAALVDGPGGMPHSTHRGCSPVPSHDDAQVENDASIAAALSADGPDTGAGRGADTDTDAPWIFEPANSRFSQPVRRFERDSGNPKHAVDIKHVQCLCVIGACIKHVQCLCVGTPDVS